MSEPEPTHGEPGPGHRRRTAGPPLQTPSPAPNRTRTPDQGLRHGSRRLDPARTLTDPGPHRRGITGEHRLESAPASPGAAGGRRPRTECHEPEDRIAEPAPTPRLDQTNRTTIAGRRSAPSSTTAATRPGHTPRGEKARGRTWAWAGGEHEVPKRMNEPHHCRFDAGGPR